ncbi:MYB-related protein [Rhynchospora pubera]|uniref:MYB-related protein n=1 Tax=Rhynchospora pubera TaxID=906938 RepID=A0AAV8HL61_9POAL|nr:MYB-related protein [Rhynchospora pubera]KAJ4816585.1 MYB-related protein [Rhynchospora pubera]
MEVVAQEENGEHVNNGSELVKSRASDPLVYQLVRVEGDGTLVPATEDEVMQFGHLLDDGKVEDLPSVEDISKVETFLPASVLCTDKSNLKGLSQSENIMKDEQKLHTNLEDANNPNKPDKNPPSQDISAETTQNSTVVNTAQASETEKTDATSTPAIDNPSPIPDMSTVGSKPNFSLLTKDEICLDGLSIRELQEVFLATFGRRTNVKDKSWLKRRIAMGLTKSCKVPTSNFVIKDKQIVPKEGGVQYEENLQESCETESPQEFTRKRVRNANWNFENTLRDGKSRVEFLSPEEDSSTSKRMRKPTKRYIEELSSLDNREESMRLTSLFVRNNHDRPVRSRVRPNREIGSLGAAFRTRNDSLGGFQVQVPFASRARRCRPRKNLVAFMPHADSLLVEDENIMQEVETEKLTRTMRASTHKNRQLKDIANKQEKENQEETVAESDEVPEILPDEAQSEGENANDSNHDECESLPKGSHMRRKHHRAWTLCEVLKLVEGVARYGAGRWSEIRRLSFASYSYRTSVDLKDKWRNLLKASMAQPSVEKEGKHTRKPASLPIPTSILSRVRELAELHAQAGSESPTNKFTQVHGRKVVQGKGSGFL